MPISCVRRLTENDIAKRLIDFGIHPPTMSWPIHHCLMIEPTETESLATLDEFIEAMLAIADEIENDPGVARACVSNRYAHRGELTPSRAQAAFDRPGADVRANHRLRG